MPIRMMGLVDLTPINPHVSSYHKMVEDTERALQLKNEKLDPVGHEDHDIDNDGDSDDTDAYLKNRRNVISRSMKDESLSRFELKQLVKEEYQKLMDEVKKNESKIQKGLEDIRKECFAEMFKRTREMGNNFTPAMEKRIQINTVAEMLDMKVNELMLYFLNNVKHTNDRHLVEYRQGHVTFYTH